MSSCWSLVLALPRYSNSYFMKNSVNDVQTIEEDKFEVHDNGHFVATAPAVAWLLCLASLIGYYFC